MPAALTIAARIRNATAWADCGPELLAHRGCWQRPEERNTLPALVKALKAGYGLETDVRDSGGELVISHDPPQASATTLRELLACYRKLGCQGTLALNVKADGLAAPLQALLAEYGVTRYFVFDMSVPDLLQYLRRGLTVFSRQSEYEPSPAAYAQAHGIWLDAFYGEWFDQTVIARHLDQGKRVCVVSSELHRRPHARLWRMLRELEAPAGQLLVCTDFPQAFAEP